MATGHCPWYTMVPWGNIHSKPEPASSQRMKAGQGWRGYLVLVWPEICRDGKKAMLQSAPALVGNSLAGHSPMDIPESRASAADVGTSLERRKANGDMSHSEAQDAGRRTGMRPPQQRLRCASARASPRPRNDRRHGTCCPSTRRRISGHPAGGPAAPDGGSRPGDSDAAGALAWQSLGDQHLLSIRSPRPQAAG